MKKGLRRRRGSLRMGFFMPACTFCMNVRETICSGVSCKIWFHCKAVFVVWTPETTSMLKNDPTF